MARFAHPQLWFVGGAILLLNSASLQVEAPAQGAPPHAPDFQPVEFGPRILALQERLKSGDRRSALEQFWQQVSRTGTPLIEPVGDASHEVVVTFLWRGDRETRTIGLLVPLTNSPGMPSFPLRHLPDSDVWYKCWRLRDDLRFGYRFVLNAKPGERPHGPATRSDPLNPHRMEISFDEGAPLTQFSIAAMPQGAEPPWVIETPGVPAGQLEQRQFESPTLANQREIWIYTPPGYQPGTPTQNPLLVLFDGFAYQDWIPVPTILNNLIHAGKVPPMIAVLVGNPSGARMSELAYNPKFADFVSKELLPWVQAHWRVRRDPRTTIIGGYSAGGAAAAYVALLHPALFGNVLSQSGAFWTGSGDVKWEWLVTQYESRPKLPITFFVEAGRLENVAQEGPTLLSANRHLVAVLRRKGYSVTYEEVGGTHEPVQWRGQFADGLVALLHR